MKYQTIEWDDALSCPKIIDQTVLPDEIKLKTIKTVQEIFDAIQRLEIRGAPAIGIAAAFGMVLAIDPNLTLEKQKLLVLQTADYLAQSRPTAVNLFWAINRMKKNCEDFIGEKSEFKPFMLAKAKEIHAEDAELCEKMSDFGTELIQDGMTILTHCNAGALATGGRGTAVGVITKAFELGKKINVIVDETRPLLQGSRLTAWELGQTGIPYKIITDNMCGHFMKSGIIDLVITGADRIAANGDTANKIGTYSVAVLAKYHGIPFYIAAPASTFDAMLTTGDEIPVEQRNPDEIRKIKGISIAPRDAEVLNPAFDVTPAHLIDGIITEHGILKPPYDVSIREFLSS